MLVATDIPGWAKPCFLHIGYVEEDQNHGVWCGGVPVLCLVPVLLVDPASEALSLKTYL